MLTPRSGSARVYFLALTDSLFHKGIALLQYGKFGRSIDQYIQRSLRLQQPEHLDDPLHKALIGLFHDQQVDIAGGPGISPGPRAEQNDSLRLVLDRQIPD